MWMLFFFLFFSLGKHWYFPASFCGGFFFFRFFILLNLFCRNLIFYFWISVVPFNLCQDHVSVLILPCRNSQNSSFLCDQRHVLVALHHFFIFFCFPFICA
uniref:Uncharacterized protein n=1 Tax=Rhizophora mucronata TaxID=61149 RepID=A0A2P2MPI2_RHIMU